MLGVMPSCREVLSVRHATILRTLIRVMNEPREARGRCRTAMVSAASVRLLIRRGTHRPPNHAAGIQIQRARRRRATRLGWGRVGDVTDPDGDEERDRDKVLPEEIRGAGGWELMSVRRSTPEPTHNLGAAMPAWRRRRATRCRPHGDARRGEEAPQLSPPPYCSRVCRCSRRSTGRQPVIRPSRRALQRPQRRCAKGKPKSVMCDCKT